MNNGGEFAKSSARMAASLADELQRSRGNGRVGTELVSETERVRVWTIRLNPGDRLAFHCHVLDYFWVAINAGHGRSQFEDGSIAETNYYSGEIQHSHYQMGEYKIHDLQNIGDTELVFTTVEFKDSANPPLPL